MLSFVVKLNPIRSEIFKFEFYKSQKKSQISVRISKVEQWSEIFVLRVFGLRAV
jgi:hypothetical protein